jgi:hypothetical protein
LARACGRCAAGVVEAAWKQCVIDLPNQMLKM